jgi:hypothetical protein
MTDDYNPQQYNWLHDYIWPRLEPAVMELAGSVHEQNRNVNIAIEGDKSPSYPFSASVYFAKKTLWVIVQKDLAIYFDCGPWLATWSDSHQLACHSNISIERGKVIIAEGPIVMFDLGDESRIRHDVDIWIDATVKFVRQSGDLVERELE